MDKLSTYSSDETIILLQKMGFNLHFIQQLAKEDSIRERTESSNPLLLYRYKLNKTHCFDPLKDRKLQRFVDWLHGKKHLLIGDFPSPNALWNYHFTHSHNPQGESVDGMIEEFEIRLYDAKTIDDLIELLQKSPGMKGKIQSLDKTITYELSGLINGFHKIAKWHSLWLSLHHEISTESNLAKFQDQVKKLLTGHQERMVKSRTDQVRENIEKMKTQIPNVMKHTTRAHGLRAHVGRILSLYDISGKYPVPISDEDQEIVSQLYTSL